MTGVSPLTREDDWSEGAPSDAISMRVWAAVTPNTDDYAWLDALVDPRPANAFDAFRFNSIYMTSDCRHHRVWINTGGPRYSQQR